MFLNWKASGSKLKYLFIKISITKLSAADHLLCTFIAYL